MNTYKINGPAETAQSGRLDWSSKFIESHEDTWSKVVEQAIEQELITEPGTYVVRNANPAQVDTFLAFVKVELPATPRLVVV